MVIDMHCHAVPNKSEQAAILGLRHAFLATQLRVGMENADHDLWESGTVYLC